MLLGSSKKRRTSKSVFHLRHFTQISFLRSNLFRQRRHYKRKFFPSTCKATDDENIARQIAEYLLHAFKFFLTLQKQKGLVYFSCNLQRSFLVRDKLLRGDATRAILSAVCVPKRRCVAEKNCLE